MRQMDICILARLAAHGEVVECFLQIHIKHLELLDRQGFEQTIYLLVRENREWHDGGCAMDQSVYVCPRVRLVCVKPPLE